MCCKQGEDKAAWKKDSFLSMAHTQPKKPQHFMSITEMKVTSKVREDLGMCWSEIEIISRGWKVEVDAWNSSSFPPKSTFWGLFMA